MDPNALIGMAFTLILAILVGGFVLLLPLSRRLAELLEARLRERSGAPAPAEELAQLRESLAQLTSELQRVSDRQDFVEKLLSGRMDPRRLGGGEG